MVDFDLLTFGLPFRTPSPKAILDEDDVKIADAAMKELEMFMPSVSRSDSKSKSR